MPVVLLDEADVFLEQRTLTDLQRNALVSVFLRVLEYYDGKFSPSYLECLANTSRNPNSNIKPRWDLR